MSTDATTGAFAHVLFQQLERALRVAPAADGRDHLADALAKVDGFLAAPAAGSFLAASRALRQARLRHASDKIAALHDDRLFRRGVDAMRHLPGLDAGNVDTLAELPADGRTGHRLLALAQLIEAHLELSGRAAAAFREIRRKLAAVPPPPRPRAY